MSHVTPPHTTPRGHAALLAVGLLTLLGGLAVVAFSARAEDRPAPRETDVRYLAVSGDGPNARAWYDGAPPTGVPVQEALNTFATQGFRVAEVSQAFVVSSAEQARWTILLQRSR